MAQTYVFYFSKIKTKFVTGTVALFIIFECIIIIIKMIKEKVGGTSTIYLTIFETVTQINFLLQECQNHNYILILIEFLLFCLEIYG